MGRFTINTSTDWNEYYNNVKADFHELKEVYPFSSLCILPTVKPELATIRVVAANKDLIESIGAIQGDFTGEYSRELNILIPTSYRVDGCEVYGAKWVDLGRFENKDLHFFHNAKLFSNGYQLCVGTPESFSMMKNVILENVRTAENMLIAYERVMTGVSRKLELIAYSHGDDGRAEFRRSKTRYTTR